MARPPSEGARLREAWLTGLAIFGVAAAGLIVTYRTASHSLVEQIRAQIRQTAAVAASEINVPLHDTLTRPAQMGGADYRRASEPLLRIRRSVPEIFYAYTLVPGPSGPHFTLDSSFYVRNAGDTTPVARTGDPYAEAPEAARTALRTGRVSVSRDPYTDRWGTFLSSYAPFRDASGRIAGIVGVDISLARLHRDLWPLRLTLGLALAGSAGLGALAGFGRWRSLRARAVAMEEFVRSRELAEQAAAAAEAANRAKDTFLATVSHEIRTPLNGVIGLTEVVLGTRLSRHQRECLETAQTSAHALLTILNDILDFSAIEAGALRLSPGPTPLRGLAEEVLDLCAAQGHARGNELTLLIETGVPAIIETDAARLRQILLNLLSNAVRFTAGGEVELTVSRVDPAAEGGQRLAFAVRDSGSGIPAAALNRLFLPFSQVEAPGQRPEGGTGLGLAISQRLALALGGDIEVESEIGRGSRFTLVLPLAVPGPGSGGDAATAGPSSLEPPVLEGRTVLVLTTSGANRRLLLDTIRQQAGRAEVAATLAEFTARLEATRFDLAILDLPATARPGFDPAEVAAVIRRHRHGTPLPLVVCAPLPGEGIAAADAPVLLKPIKPKALLQALRTALEGEGAARGASAGESQRSGERDRSGETENQEQLAPPTAGPEAPPRLSGSAGAPPDPEEFAREHPLRILVAEDNAINRLVCDLMLRRLGYTAAFANDGMEVLDSQRTLDPDVILMDIRMPGLDGLEATRRIRSTQTTPHRPWIVAVTASALPGDRSLALASGMDDFLSKPIDGVALAEALKRGHTALRS